MLVSRYSQVVKAAVRSGSGLAIALSLPLGGPMAVPVALPMGITLGVVLSLAPSTPVHAQSIARYSIDTSKNSFEFVTTAGVTPQAQWVESPGRIVIDLPGIQIKRSRREPGRGVIQTIRFGQFQPGVGRIVLELQPGYTPDVSKIKVRGVTQRQWVVEMPESSSSSTSQSNPNSPS